MNYYVKEICYLDDGYIVVNILEFDFKNNSYKYILLGNEIPGNPHCHDDLEDSLDGYMDWIRCKESNGTKIRDYVILTHDECEEELFTYAI